MLDNVNLKKMEKVSTPMMKIEHAYHSMSKDEFYEYMTYMMGVLKFNERAIVEFASGDKDFYDKNFSVTSRT
jgi:hypothetical protein